MSASASRRVMGRNGKRLVLGRCGPPLGGACAIGLASEQAPLPLAAPELKPIAAREPDAVKPNGKELFTREWLPRDPRAHGGDGLGPVFNDSSCVACHNLGGVGGGGPK